MAGYNSITQEQLHKIVSYDPETGAFTWKTNRYKFRVGAKAGSINSEGRVQLLILRCNIPGHRLAWMMTHGSWPKLGIDHINGDPTDNRIANLREATQLVNTQNRRAANKNTKSGLLGASWKSKIGRWVAQIRHSGRLHHLGYFETAEAAHARYLAEKRSVHKGCSI